MDLLEFFSKYYSPDLIDFSSSSAPAGFEPACMGGEDLDYVAPTGADDLRELIASDYEGLTRENIVLASGASEALVAFAHAVLDARSIVWCARGTYPSFVEATSRLGVQVRNSPLPEPHLDVLALCNPTVPDGQVLNPGVFDRARWLLVDESHIDLFHQGPRHLLVGFVFEVAHGPSAVLVADDAEEETDGAVFGRGPTQGAHVDRLARQPHHARIVAPRPFEAAAR